MNTTNAKIAPVVEYTLTPSMMSRVNMETIPTRDTAKLALKFLEIIDAEHTTYAAAEIALDYAKQLLDNMQISGFDKINNDLKKIVNSKR